MSRQKMPSLLTHSSMPGEQRTKRKASSVRPRTLVASAPLIERRAARQHLALQKQRQTEAATQAKQAFLARISHELRTPLNVILGFAQLLEMDDLTPDKSESITHILQSGHHLLESIDSLLTFMDTNITVKRHLTCDSIGCIELPLTMPSGRVTAPKADLPVTGVATLPHPCTVLHIEDNLLHLRLVERMLASHPQIRIIPAMQGGQGLELAQTHCPDLILLDLQLPDIPGDEVLQRLRADTRTADIPVVVLSAEVFPDYPRWTHPSGAQVYLSKPLNIQTFFHVLQDMCAAAISLGY